MTQNTHIKVIEGLKDSTAIMEDFGRFNPAETVDLDSEITDESFDRMYAEENAGA